MTYNMENANDILDFSTDGFLNVDIRREEGCLRLRTNVRTREEFQKWREVYCLKTNTCFNSYKLYPVGIRKLFRQRLICHHGVKHKEKKKKSTGCRVFMNATIKMVLKKSLKKDKLIKDFPCFIDIQGAHNHPTDSVDSLKQLRVQKSTREMFEKYFEQGMTTAQARKHHQLKMDLCNDVHGQANHAINPSSRAIDYMRHQWLKSENAEQNTQCMFEAIKKYAKDNSEITLEVDRIEDRFCIMLITPFMRRVHQQVREAGEVVFVDATGCVDQLNTAVIPFICAGPAGAVPLAVLFTSSQDEVTLTKGFTMIKDALGESAFFGRGAPQSFMTDNCDAERRALLATWPSSQCFLCIFHILQQVWRWLLNSKHGIQKHNRQELLAGVKTLVYAKSKAEFAQVWDNIQAHPLAKTYPNFISYLASLMQRKEEWAIAFRSCAMLQGHHMNNFCEAAMCLMKDIVLNRCKGYNTAQLVVFMVEIFDYYMSQRLMDIAFGQQRIRPVSVGKPPLEVLTSFGYGKYSVRSHSEPPQDFEVDLTVGMCTCTKGEDGGICKHQTVCAEYSMTLVPQMFDLTGESRQWLAALASGLERAPNSGEGVPNNKPSTETKHEELEDCDVDDYNENIPEDANSVAEARVKAKASAHLVADALIESAGCFGNGETEVALIRFMQKIKAVKSTEQLNSLLFSVGSPVRKGGAGRGAGRGKSSTITKRNVGRPRGAAKGR